MSSSSLWSSLLVHWEKLPQLSDLDYSRKVVCRDGSQQDVTCSISAIMVINVLHSELLFPLLKLSHLFMSSFIHESLLKAPSAG